MATNSLACSLMKNAYINMLKKSKQSILHINEIINNYGTRIKTYCLTVCEFPFVTGQRNVSF